MPLAFTAPTDDGGASISNYTATCTTDDNALTRTGTNTSSPITVLHLRVGHTYTCTVTATNSNGDGVASAASDGFTVTGTAPTAPGSPSASKSGTSVDVSFTPPADDGGSAITGYSVDCDAIDDGTTRSNTGTSSPITVTNLDKGKTYICAVRAANSLGPSVIATTSPFTIDTTVPGAPAAPTITKQSGGVVVTFSAPADAGGLTISGYTATCTSSDGGASGSQSAGASPITVTGLTNGKTYSCTVIATNNDGDSAASAASSALLLAAGPVNSAAPAINGTVIAERTLTATNGTWTGYPAPTFTRQWKRCNVNGTGCVNIAGATHITYKVTNDDIGKRLKLVVTGTNVAGAASASRTTAVVRPVPASISGPFYYKRGRVFRSTVFTVTAAAYGDTVWAATPDGNVVGPHFGPHGGTLLDRHLNRPIIGIQITPDGKGYWMFAGDGGVFTFGNAHFYGSTGSKRLNAPIVEMATTPDGRGYWLFAADGGVFTFGNARFYGSTGSLHLAHPVVAMLPTIAGHGYWLVTADGQAIRFGDATNIGSVTSLHRTDIVGLVSTGAGYRFVTSNLQLLAPR